MEEVGVARSAEATSMGVLTARGSMLWVSEADASPGRLILSSSMSSRGPRLDLLVEGLVGRASTSVEGRRRSDPLLSGQALPISVQNAVRLMNKNAVICSLLVGVDRKTKSAIESPVQNPKVQHALRQLYPLGTMRLVVRLTLCLLGTVLARSMAPRTAMLSAITNMTNGVELPVTCALSACLGSKQDRSSSTYVNVFR